MTFYSNFEWKNAFLHSFEFASSIAFLYLCCCLFCKRFIAARTEEINRNLFLKEFVIPTHNLFLSALSFLILIGTTYEVWQRCNVEGIFWIFCERLDQKSSGPLFFWSYVYYLTKYYELLDTFLQLVQGKIPPHFFLHVYHHSCVILMCWYWLEYCPTLQFVGIIFNLIVHIVMYYYYYLRSVGISPVWKKYVTTIQIVQFVTSLVCFLVTISLEYSNYTCNGIWVLYFCTLFNLSLLLGFINVLSINFKRE